MKVLHKVIKVVAIRLQEYKLKGFYITAPQCGGVVMVPATSFVLLRYS